MCIVRVATSIPYTMTSIRMCSRNWKVCGNAYARDVTQGYKSDHSAVYELASQLADVSKKMS